MNRTSVIQSFCALVWTASIASASCSKVAQESTGTRTSAEKSTCHGLTTWCSGTCDGVPISTSGSWEGWGENRADACSRANSQCIAVLEASCEGTIGGAFESNCSSTCAGDEKRSYRNTTEYTIPIVFLDFLERNNGMFNVGLPLANAKEETLTVGGKSGAFLTQLFERHRLEHHPENAGTPYEVQLGRIGAELVASRGYEDSEAWKSDTIAVDPAFVATYHANGLAGIADKAAASLALYGRPLAPAIDEAIDGKVFRVQWFERARFEAHPKNQPPYHVLLGRLGAEAIAQGIYY